MVKDIRADRPKEDITGKTYHEFTVLGYKEHGKWVCQCSCGNIRYIGSYDLKSGHRKSCGCKKEYYRLKNTKRKANPDYVRLYTIWSQMKNRCYNTASVSYDRYGAKGVAVCDEWKNSYYAFQSWAKENGYANNLSIDRINNNAGYSPDNCKWSTLIEQANNKSNNRYLNIDGESKTIAQWSRISGTDQCLIRERISRLGWNEQDAVYGRSGVDPTRKNKCSKYRFLTEDEKVYISENYKAKGEKEIAGIFNISLRTVRRYKDYKQQINN